MAFHAAPTVSAAAQEPQAGLVHAWPHETVMLTSYVSVPGGLTQMAWPSSQERLSQLRWMVGFHASSSVRVKFASERMVLQVSFSWT